MAYEQATKQDWDYAASMAQKYDEGMEKGREAEKIEIAQRLLASGIEKTAIARLTGLSLDKVQLLVRKNPL